MPVEKQQVSAFIDLDGLQLPLNEDESIALNNEASNPKIDLSNHIIRTTTSDTTDYIDWPINDSTVNWRNNELHESNVTSLAMLFMAISCGLIIFGGVLGNVTLVLTLCSRHSVRLRNPLLLAVCIADLLVTGLSAPVTLLNVVLNHKLHSMPFGICQGIYFVQMTPVAASTLSFFLLSLDRYATVKHLRLSQLRQRRHLHVSLAVCSWIISALVTIPFLFTSKTFAKSGADKNASKQSANKAIMTTGIIFESRITTQNTKCDCYAESSYSNSLFASFVLFHTIIVYILPGLGVLFNHYAVRQKLCALSLTARAAHGELPLPMPILRRKTHMVIVTGLPKNKQMAGGGKGTTDDTSNDADIQMCTLNPHKNCNMISANPISPRAMREIRAHSKRQHVTYSSGRFGRDSRVATPGIPLPQTSTLRSRRHLANLLIASALIFIVCWTPHVFCVMYKNLGHKDLCSKTLSYFNLLLGYMYSVISPIIYWALNYNSLRQSPCAPLVRLRSLQRFLNSRFRSQRVPTPPLPSSTNEAALGAFNPQLIKLTPKQYRTPASSNYFY